MSQFDNSRSNWWQCKQNGKSEAWKNPHYSSIGARHSEGEVGAKVLLENSVIPVKNSTNLISSFDVVFPESDPPTREEILELSKGAIGILWATHSPLNAEALDAAGPQLKAISTMSAGLDYVDIPEVKRRGIPFGYTPSILNDAVADMAIGLMIAAGRRFHEGELKIRNGEWTPGPRWLLGKDIRGSTVGIVGLGMIGQTIAKRLQGFDIGKLVYTGRSRKSPEVEQKYKAHYLSFDELVKESDYVVIAVPLTEETRNMFNRTVFDQMKPSSILVNIARGGIVNQGDLYLALKNKQIFSAGLDVMNPEPLPTDDPILDLENLGKTD